jgi:hypothetical protein
VFYPVLAHLLKFEVIAFSIANGQETLGKKQSEIQAKKINGSQVK